LVAVQDSKTTDDWSIFHVTPGGESFLVDVLTLQEFAGRYTATEPLHNPRCERKETKTCATFTAPRPRT
jgi:hypothetical protein